MRQWPPPADGATAGVLADEPNVAEHRCEAPQGFQAENLCLPGQAPMPNAAAPELPKAAAPNEDDELIVRTRSQARPYGAEEQVPTPWADARDADMAATRHTQPEAARVEQRPVAHAPANRLWSWKAPPNKVRDMKRAKTPVAATRTLADSKETKG